jgi:hypothetical protein
MTMTPESYTPSAVPPPPTPSSGRPFKWLACGCVALLVLALLVIGSCVALLMTGGREVEPYAEAFFAALQRQDYDAAYGMLSPDFQASHPKPEMDDLFRRVHEGLGALQDRRTVGLNWNADAGGTVVTVRYRAQYERGEADVELVFLKAGEKWLVQSVAWDSPQL